MNMNPAHRFVPTFCSRGVQFGSICSRSPSLLGYLLCRALRARLLIHFTQFLPQLHQLAELLRSRKRCIHQLLCGGWPRSFLAHRRALFNYDVESGVPGNCHNDVLVECQVVQFLITCDTNVSRNPIPQKCTFRKWRIDPIGSHQIRRCLPEACKGFAPGSSFQIVSRSLHLSRTEGQAHGRGIDLFGRSVRHLDCVETESLRTQTGPACWRLPSTRARAGYKQFLHSFRSCTRSRCHNGCLDCAVHNRLEASKLAASPPTGSI